MIMYHMIFAELQAAVFHHLLDLIVLCGSWTVGHMTEFVTGRWTQKLMCKVTVDKMFSAALEKLSITSSVEHHEFAL